MRHVPTGTSIPFSLSYWNVCSEWGRSLATIPNIAPLHIYIRTQSNIRSQSYPQFGFGAIRLSSWSLSAGRSSGTRAAPHAAKLSTGWNSIPPTCHSGDSGRDERPRQHGPRAVLAMSVGKVIPTTVGDERRSTETTTVPALRLAIARTARSGRCFTWNRERQRTLGRRLPS